MHPSLHFARLPRIGDLTSAEIKTLYQVQSTKYAYRPHYYDQTFHMLTFDEVYGPRESLRPLPPLAPGPG